MKRILIVDDEANMCMVLKMTLEKDGYSITTASNGEEAINLIKREVYDLIISDLKMPGIDGIGILEYLKKTERSIPIIFITAYGSIETAVNAMKMGAFDFITKPFNRDVIRHTVRSIFKIDTLETENRLLKEFLNFRDFIYRSPQMADILETVKKIATVSTPVLLTGESGTGKGIIARMIHTLGGEERPFIRINCPSIPQSLFESELFGFQKGAFTGATRDFKGKLRMADGGTVFFDEIADLPPNIQPKLLRVMEDSTFEPLGSTSTISINTRFISATNRRLDQLVENGSFRKDLYYRLNTITIRIPPLRERRGDIIPLAEYFLKRYSNETGKHIESISEKAKETMLDYNWPGNVRELKNAIERAVVLSSGGEIDVKDLNIQPQNNSATPNYWLGNNKESLAGPGRDKLSETERKLLLEALISTNWNISRAAKKLGITRSTIRYRIDKYGLRE